MALTGVLAVIHGVLYIALAYAALAGAATSRAGHNEHRHNTWTYIDVGALPSAEASCGWSPVLRSSPEGV